MMRKAQSPATAAVLEFALVSFTAACGEDPPAADPLPEVTDSVAPVDPAGTAASPSPGEVLGEAGGELSQEVLEGKVGQEVTVVGEVATVVGANAFTLGGDEVGENPVLVISASAPEVAAGESVRVDGQVVRFSVPGVEEDLDIDIVDNEFEDFDGDPVVQATSIAPA